MVEVEFFFYFGCPWTWFAFARIQETALRTNARIRWRPVLIDRVKAAAAGGGTAHAPAGPAQARYQAKDRDDWARFCGVALRRPPPYPVPAEWSLRGACVADAEGRMAAYAEQVFRACFERQEDIADLDAAVRAAVAVGFDAGDFRRRVSEPATLREIERNSDELVARGGFGSPTMFVGDDMYFGNDRMPLVELALTRAHGRVLVAPGAHGQA